MKLRFTARWPASLVSLGLLTTCRFLASTCFGQRVELNENEAEATVLDSVAVSAEITGRVAVTTFDLVYRNPNPQALDGTLLFPLLTGQHLVGYALDVNGVMREAAVVPSVPRRSTAGDPERDETDPEAGQGPSDSFRLRIGPFPGQGTRQVRLSYEENLGSSPPASYRLNLDFPRPISHFRLTLNVHAGARLPAQVRTTLDLPLPPWRNGQFMEIERNDFDARGVFEVILPKPDRPRVITGRYQGKEYFYAEVPNTPLLLARPPPKVVGLLWDSSWSGQERNHEREYQLLDAWFADLKNLEVRLLRIRDKVTREGTYAVTNGDWSSLQKELKATVYDGATSLDGLVDDPKIEAWILFSDGCFNFGALATSLKLPLRAPVHTVLSGASANPLWMRGLAANQSGEYVNLMEFEPAKAAFTLEAQSTRLFALDYNADAVASVAPAPGTALLGDSFALTGILRQKDAKIRLLVGHNRENAQAIELPLLSGDDPSNLAPRAWALAQIEQLSIDRPANLPAIRQTSREFGIVTPDTGLLFLETVNDYLRSNVPPPDELREEWEARRPASPALGQDDNEHREAVLRAFNQRVDWWEKNYSPEPPKEESTAVNAAGVAPSGHFTDAVPPGPEEEYADADPAAPADKVPAKSEPGAWSREARHDDLLAPEALFPPNDHQGPGAPGIGLQPWSPQSGYIDRLHGSPAERRYQTYLEARAEHQREPGFYLDCADFFFENGDPAAGLRILSNLADLAPDDPALLRVLAYRLLEANRADLAAPVLERVRILRPDEPQSWRDLARACVALGKFQRAVDLLWAVVTRSWDSRFPEIELVALEELNGIIATCNQKLDLSRIDPRLQKNLPLDLRVVVSWDASDCDLDLWVSDPSGHVAKYDFPFRLPGGRMSPDFPGGFGPEEFTLRRARPGAYTIKLNYYGDRRQTTLYPATADVRLITGFGTPHQQEKRFTLRLKSAQETFEIGRFEIRGEAERVQK